MRFGFELTTRRNLRVARCLLPQHEDTHPSFTIYPDQRFHCFGCGSTGDVIDLTAMMSGQSLSDTLRDMARTVDTQQLPPAAPRPQPKRLKRPFRPDIRSLTRAAGLYSWILKSHPAGQPGRDYLHSRGIDPNARGLIGPRLGYCPDDDRMNERLAAASLSLMDANRAGIIITDGPSGEKTERFARRIVVSELSSNGRVALYMTGRSIDDADLKFDAIPGNKTPLGLNALSLTTASQPVYLTEGIFDWLALAQWDLTAVATLGVNITDRILDLMATRLAQRNIAIAFDADSEGVKKGRTLAEKLLERTNSAVSLVTMPDECKDVADLAALHGRDGIEILARRTAPI